ncbi:phosphonate ABC transporter substrate-binding protein [Aphanothece hegewaldii CCALA 016]|uniref:Phosphonate ABC transporter substrate-binding protein n=1 Tax=Aphanothece hegewaldii CCALA 016 TaxID=2107694 RepID=A0A2T1LSN8_9CHRO|nr:phosphate/phosphite/phosphonate ABC transporter substrate-binding protein [Aphanothece hegewaldii]PSF33066.1 phosphonate ABC transporter substrate-binding protein [Aphanothece hegewaldii CCALA 016]
MLYKLLVGVASLSLLVSAGLSLNSINNKINPAFAETDDISQKEKLVAQAPNNRIVIVFATRRDATDLDKKAQAVTDFLSKQTGLKVEAVVADETAAIEALRSNRADVAFLGGRGAIKAEQLTGARMYLAEIRSDYSGGKTYRSVLVVRKDSKLETENNVKKTLRQLKGKKIAFASRTSGSGYIIPTSEFVGQGMIKSPDDYGKFFSQVIYGDGYSSALQAVLRGQVDVAAVSEYALNPPWITAEEAKQLKVILGIPGVPAHGIVIDNDVPAATREKLINALLALNEPKNKAMFTTLYNSTQLVRVDHDQHLAPMKTALQRAKIDP